MHDEIVQLEKKKEGSNEPIAMDILKGGGYYAINNVRLDVTTNQYVDVYILAESIMDKDLRKKLDELNEVTSTTGIVKKPKIAAPKGSKQQKV